MGLKGSLVFDRNGSNQGLKSDQNGIESWIEEVDITEFLDRLKSDQNGIERSLTLNTLSMSDKVEIRPEWD